MREKQDLLRDIICQHIYDYQVGFLRRLADDIENGYMGERESECWTDFLGTIAEDIEYVFD